MNLSRSFLLAGIGLLMSQVDTLAQSQIATFEDGTKIEYEFLSDRPEDISSLNVYWGFFAANVVEGLRVQYNMGNDASVSLQTNVFGASMYGNTADSLFYEGKPPAARSFRLRGSYVISKSEKTKTMGLTLKSESTGYNEVTAYQLQHDVPRSYAWAVRAGLGYRNTDLLMFAPYGLTYTEAALGISRVRTRNIALMTTNGKGKPRKYRGSSQMTLFADALFFLGTEAPRTEVAAEIDADNFSPRNAGVEIGWEGRTTFWGKRDWGFFGSAGYIITPAHQTMSYGFGLYMGFVNKYA